MLVDEPPGGARDGILVKRYELTAQIVHASRDALDAPARHEWTRSNVAEVVHALEWHVAAPDLQEVPESGVREHAGPGAASLQDRIQAQRRPVDERVDPGQIIA